MPKEPFLHFNKCLHFPKMSNFFMYILNQHYLFCMLRYHQILEEDIFQPMVLDYPFFSPIYVSSVIESNFQMSTNEQYHWYIIFPYIHLPWLIIFTSSNCLHTFALLFLFVSSTMVWTSTIILLHSIWFIGGNSSFENEFLLCPPHSFLAWCTSASFFFCQCFAK